MHTARLQHRHNWYHQLDQCKNSSNELPIERIESTVHSSCNKHRTKCHTQHKQHRLRALFRLQSRGPTHVLYAAHTWNQLCVNACVALGRCVGSAARSCRTKSCAVLNAMQHSNGCGRCCSRGDGCISGSSGLMEAMQCTSYHEVRYW
jgi:hypothetical protein